VVRARKNIPDPRLAFVWIFGRKDLAEDIFFTNPSGGHHDHRFRGRCPSHSHMSNENICNTCSALQECKKRDGQRHQRCLILASDPDISVIRIATALKLTSWSIAFFEHWVLTTESTHTFRDKPGQRLGSWRATCIAHKIHFHRALVAR
jgi:hypothetical protein